MDNYLTQDENNAIESDVLYKCDICDFKSQNKCNYKKHLETKKHYQRTHISTVITELPKKAYACACGKRYSHHTGLSRHRKVCDFNTVTDCNENLSDFDDDDEIDLNYDKKTKEEEEICLTKELISELIKNSTELRELLFEQQTMMKDMSKQCLATNNSLIQNTQNTLNQNCQSTVNQHKSFNLNFYLNETCKNAMDIMEFVDSIELQLSDLERVGELGYADGISDIFVDRLNAIDSSLRPVHCSDLKREILFIRSGNVWVKEADAKPLLIKAIKKLANENIKMISHWRAKYPDCTQASSRKNDAYLRIVSNSMCGIDEAETKRNIEKIVTNVARKVVIDKRGRH